MPDPTAASQLLMQHMQSASLVIDPTHDRILHANPACCALLGWPLDELLALRASRLWAHDLGALVTFTEEVQVRGNAWRDGLGLLRRDGERLEVEIDGSRLEHDSVILLGLLIQQRRRLDALRGLAEAERYQRQGLLEWQGVERIFRQFERQNQLILGAAGEGIYGVNRNGETTFVNPAAERILGWRADDLIGHNIHDLIHHHHPDGSTYDGHTCPIYAAFNDGEVHQVADEVFWNKDGKPIPVDYTSTPLRDDGELVGAVVVFRDISERLETERRLRQALSEVQQLKQRLELENAYLQEEIRGEYAQHDLVGRSAAMQQVIHQIELVAPTGANVLITGESGTGKELIARAIHDNSGRSRRPLIRVNCAAVPRELFESEFFGHIRGAFTGALNDRVGRFELADGGTLFLDEVGEIPLELQSKLLRVLQEQQLERVGDTRTRQVDVRVIAATNRDLRQEVRAGRFREDLYFRLNVFPIESAPLRQRPEDIPPLAQHFLSRACRQLNRPEPSLRLADIQRLQAYSWPGNIRELENLIERAVIISPGTRLRLDLPNDSGNDAPSQPQVEQEMRIFTQGEQRRQMRENLIAALKACAGRISGKDGAARLLELKPTTLRSRLESFAIDPRDYRPRRSQPRRYETSQTPR
ncbi:sigma 54-interacting transcriptional regulator [Pseudomonas toyotomiensis]|uniref:Sigma 54-interacting transcriptional regulator n=1 Tax=Ectopseudomonas toyotomiensis TaxID=554344 RepID=A0AA42LK81_9GAMM|nr:MULTISPECIES: sigma 54-interacting transcriptional regulator [Pseudomonas]MDH0700788.1 sigma 54-interacting transcriptional regulator [Pseudomonas toyotomiensis]WKC39479.1 sigma 54-interacting transcriptional regulator [Pseudomonas chengduensis]